MNIIEENKNVIIWLIMQSLRELYTNVFDVWWWIHIFFLKFIIFIKLISRD